MEVNRPVPKRLHRHATPIALLAAGLLVVALLAFTQHRPGTLDNKNTLVQAFTTSIVRDGLSPHAAARADAVVGHSSDLSNVGKSVGASINDPGQ